MSGAGFRERTLQIMSRVIQQEAPDDNSSQDSSPAPSLPPEIQYLMDYDFENIDSPEGDNKMHNAKSTFSAEEVLQKQNEVSVYEINNSGILVPVENEQENQKQTAGFKSLDVYNDDVVMVLGEQQEPHSAKPENFEVDGCPREQQHEKKQKGGAKIVAKQKRNSGSSYVSIYSNKTVSQKTLKPRCEGSNCKRMGRQCFEITDEERQHILTDFYATGELQLHREYINRFVTISSVKTRTVKPEESRRSKTFSYFLPSRDKGRIQVCKQMFLHTLSLSEKSVRTAINKRLPSGVIEKEKRGGRRKTHADRDELIKKLIVTHINRFPRVESHYCRQYSSREYLHPDLTVQKMYRMFVTENKDSLSPIPAYETYRRIFKSMNLSFHRPKKDLCSLCSNYLNGDETKKAQLSEKYKMHVDEKKAIRKKKEEIKNMTDKECKTTSAVFDLQQVIYIPRCNDSSLFYKRRLSCFNFTIYDIRTKECHCYTWHEGVSKRGASEIATCLFKYLEYLDKQGKEEVYFFSDGCSGQNKNSIVAAMLLYCVVHLKNIKVITLDFFEPGHGQNEGDSAHSTISTALKAAGDLFLPAQLLTVLRLARKTPYIVHSLNYDDFLNFKNTALGLRILGVRKDDDEDKVDWTHIKELMVMKEQPKKIYFKKTHLIQLYKSITLLRKCVFNHPQQLNTQVPKIPYSKYNDLVSLCKGDTPVIKNSDFAAFYKNLPH